MNNKNHAGTAIVINTIGFWVRRAKWAEWNVCVRVCLEVVRSRWSLVEAPPRDEVDGPNYVAGYKITPAQHTHTADWEEQQRFGQIVNFARGGSSTYKNKRSVRAMMGASIGRGWTKRREFLCCSHRYIYIGAKNACVIAMSYYILRLSLAKLYMRLIFFFYDDDFQSIFLL